MMPMPQIWLFLITLSYLGLMGCAHKETRSHDEALGLDRQDSPGDLYVAMAAEYFRLGQYDAAVRRGEQGIREDDKNPRAYYVMAVIYQQIGQIERADENFKKALELSPNNPDIRNAYGNFHCSQRRYTQAEEQFNRALSNTLYRTPWVAMTNAGTCAARSGNPSKAESDYRRALTANPRFGPALLNMAEIEYKRGNAKGSKGYLDRFFQSNQPTPGALALGVKTERKLGQRKSAATYEQVLRKNFPGAPEIQGL